MQPKQALNVVISSFPFEGYIRPESGGHVNVARTLRRYLSPGARILDFGSGPGDKTAVAQVLGFRCSAFDVLDEEWHLAHREAIHAFYGAMGVDFLQSTGPRSYMEFGTETFDLVMLHDVLEHLHDSPRHLLIDLLELAKPEGLLYITVPNAVNIRKRFDVIRGRTNAPAFDTYYWARGAWRGHVREYVKQDLRCLAGYLDLDVLELATVNHILQKVPARMRSGYVAVTRLFPGWRDTWQLVARKRANWSPRRELPEEEYILIDPFLSIHTK